ncbi:hypothetical protein [Anaerostipes sp.]|uniref:hypothetical protein n=1 Tax=Anaerostipes sp. TaxID=1872530 RepID=UPI0025C33C63|nr:hypothetical protein [Anaerostipes sp.]MBS7008069.1 hypothetical protein [Anaerostipes sp.]
MAKKTIGDCALCRKKNVELMQSHIIPKAIYKRTKTYENSRFRDFYEPQKIYQDGEKKPMLCHECEEFFSWYETKFSNLFLDKYLAEPNDMLPNVTAEINFYILTVAWRILYDDLYVYNSFSNDIERDCLEEYESKLGKSIYEKYIEENPTEVNTRTVIEEPNLCGKCFGEIIAEIEKWKKSNSPEDMSEIKNYIYRLSDLGFTDAVTQLFDSMIFGYSFYDATRTKYYIISGYKGLIITTVFLRKRSILITDDKKLLRKTCKSEKIIKEDIAKEITYLLLEMGSKYPEVQEKLDKNSLREKIEKRYEGKQKLK